MTSTVHIVATSDKFIATIGKEKYCFKFNNLPRFARFIRQRQIKVVTYDNIECLGRHSLHFRDFFNQTNLKTADHASSCGIVDILSNAPKDIIESIFAQTGTWLIPQKPTKYVYSKKIAYEVGSGIGNVLSSLPTIEYISKYFDVPITVVHLT
jgi:hypothetical protein